VEFLVDYLRFLDYSLLLFFLDCLKVKRFRHRLAILCTLLMILERGIVGRVLLGFNCSVSLNVLFPDPWPHAILITRFESFIELDVLLSIQALEQGKEFPFLVALFPRFLHLKRGRRG